MIHVLMFIISSCREISYIEFHLHFFVSGKHMDSSLQFDREKMGRGSYILKGKASRRRWVLNRLEIFRNLESNDAKLLWSEV